MMHRLGVHLVLLFALMFQNIALALPCCAPNQATEQAEQAESSYTSVKHALNEVVDQGEQGSTCYAGSPLCCALPSLPHTALPSYASSPSPVFVSTVHALSISFHQTSPERPPRV